MKAADVVVVGGGILGASVAHFLVERGYGEIVLLEKGSLCSGATRYSAANIRQHYSNEVGIRLARRALAMFENADEALGGPAGFTRCGYMVVVPAGHERALARNVELQASLGVDTELLRPDEIAELYPELDLSDVALGCLEHDSGYADPLLTVTSLVRSAERRGLRVYEGVELLGIELCGDTVARVLTGDGEIVTPVVVNAAGPWAPRVAAMVGLEYRFSFSREHEAVFALEPESGAFPIVSDVGGGIFFRPHGSDKVLVGEVYPKDMEPCDPDTYDSRADETVVQRMADRLGRRLPRLRDALVSRGYRSRLVLGYSGVYAITEDWYPIVGPADEVDGYYAAVGGSGHAFKLGPAIGEALAALIAGEKPPVDISALRPGRFVEGAVFSSVWGPGNRA